MTEYNPTLFVALPALAELDYIAGFIDCLRSQTYRKFELTVCVNQPDEWWDNAEKVPVCENNLKTILFLKKIKDIKIDIIDKSSRGEGWKEKKSGVGWARKILMNKIVLNAKNDDLIVSLDADTTFSPGYFQSLVDSFKYHPKAVAAAIPYYHKLTGDEAADRAILRYEIYLRYYDLNMLQIGSPYAFTAIGSAIVLPVKSYKAIGGITPHKSGEDFYFLQKLRKYGNVIIWNNEKVYPAARFSDRVDFGTGPAMIKGREGDWSSYPVYPQHYFGVIKKLFDLFPSLFEKSVPTPLDDFIEEKFGTADIWTPLRNNSTGKGNFIKACHHKFDALRTFQFLKWKYSKETINDDKPELIKFISQLNILNENVLNKFTFSSSSVEILDDIRNGLMRNETEIQRKIKVLCF